MWRGHSCPRSVRRVQLPGATVFAPHKKQKQRAEDKSVPLHTNKCTSMTSMDLYGKVWRRCRLCRNLKGDGSAFHPRAGSAAFANCRQGRHRCRATGEGCRVAPALGGCRFPCRRPRGHRTGRSRRAHWGRRNGRPPGADAPLINAYQLDAGRPRLTLSTSAIISAIISKSAIPATRVKGQSIEVLRIYHAVQDRP